jgi:uncharacterized Tic20 family protein
MMLVQAAPKTHPGGVHGAFIKLKYQFVIGPLFISQLPKDNPPKLMNKNKIKYLNFLLVTFFLIILFSLISDLPPYIFDH